MGWRDGCAPRPSVAEGAPPVRFAFARADHLGQRLEGLRRAVDADLATRASEGPRLASWTGAHREAFDEHRRAMEAVLTGSDLATALARLRGAWDAAAAAQHRANAATADACAAPEDVDPDRR